MDDRIVDRLHRLYAAIGECADTDLSNCQAKVVFSTPTMLGILHEFSGGNTPYQLENVAQSLIGLIHHLEYHLQRWASSHGRDTETVRAAYTRSRSLNIIHDLANAEKHGQAKGGRRTRTGHDLELCAVSRVIELCANGPGDSVAGMTFDASGRPVAYGNGTVAAVLEGEIVAADGTHVAWLRETVVEAIADLETLFAELGLRATS